MKSKEINFECIEEFVGCIVDKLEDYGDLYITAVAKFDEAREILKTVMTYDDVNFESLQIESPEVDNYHDEFVISFWMNIETLEVGCEKLKDKNGDYTDPRGDETYLFDGCSSKIIPLCDGSDLYIVGVIDECDCCEGCDECCACGCHNVENEITFVDNSSYKINGRAVSKEEYREKCAELQCEYKENMRRILETYRSFMDDVNNTFDHFIEKYNK